MTTHFSTRAWALALALAIPAAAQAAPFKLGETIPAETAFTDHNGKTHTFAELRGKVAVLEWTNYQCPFTRKHYDSGNMQKLQAESTAKGALWYSVVSSAEGRQGYVAAKDAPGEVARQGFKGTAVILDPKGELGKAFGAETTPEIFMLDASGKLAYMGAVDSIPSFSREDVAKATNYVTPAVEALLQSKSPAQPQTKPYGCAVKY